MAYKVYIVDFIETPDVEQEVLGNNFKVTALAKTKESDLLPTISDADALMMWHKNSLSKETLSQVKNCKIISRMGVGFDNVDLRAAWELGMAVCNVPDYGTDIVADQAMGFLLGLTRKLVMYNEKFRQSQKNWQPLMGSPMYRLAGKTLGIIGLGRIGTAMAMRAKGFGLNIQFYDPYVPDGKDKAIGIQQVELDQLLETSDIITLHTPLTPETHYLINDAAFEKMKDTVILINTARGHVVEFEAMARALKKKPGLMVGMDAVEFEPPAEDHPLMTAWRNQEDWIAYRIQFTPHCAFNTEESFHELRSKGANRIKDFFIHNKITNQVNNFS